MPNQTIDNVLVRQFTDRLHMTAQQMVSKTMPFVDFKTMEGDDFAYDRFGTVRSQEVTSRNQKIEFSDADFSRRKLGRNQFYVAVPLTGSDIRGMLADPNGPVIKACTAEMMRRKDRIVIGSALADVETGRDFGTTLTFAQDNGLNVDATGGSTYETLLELNRNFKKRNVDVSQVGFFISDEEEESFMLETELTSGDFTRRMPVDSGQMTFAAGNNLVVFGSDPVDDDPILATSLTERTCIAVAVTPEHSGLCVGMSEDIVVKVQERTDLVDTHQVVVQFEMGCVRTEGPLVQSFTTTIA